MNTYRKIRGSRYRGFFVDEIVNGMKYEGTRKFYNRKDAEAYAMWLNRLEAQSRRSQPKDPT